MCLLVIKSGLNPCDNMSNHLKVKLFSRIHFLPADFVLPVLQCCFYDCFFIFLLLDRFQDSTEFIGSPLTVGAYLCKSFNLKG